MRWIAKLLYPRAFKDQENYVRLLNAVREVKMTLSYHFATVHVTLDWLLNKIDERDVRDFTIGELEAELRRTLDDDEAGELADRLKKALEAHESRTVRH